MKTKKDNSLTIEVLTPLFIDTKQPFLKGDWITVDKVDKVDVVGRYYIQEKGNTGGAICVIKPDLGAKALSETHDIYKVKKLVSRYL